MTRCRWHKDETGLRWLVPGCWQRAVYGDDAECQCPKPEPVKKTCPTCGQQINEYCGCQNNEPVTNPRRMPDEIIAWPASVTPGGKTALTGSWSARRHYTDEAVRYVRVKEPCGECHLKPNETCDICGAKSQAE